MNGESECVCLYTYASIYLRVHLSLSEGDTAGCSAIFEQTLLLLVGVQYLQEGLVYVRMVLEAILNGYYIHSGTLSL